MQNQNIPSPIPNAVNPPTAAGSGGFIAQNKKQASGGLKISIIASIQAIYAKEEQKKMQMQSQGMQQAMQVAGGQGQ